MPPFFSTPPHCTPKDISLQKRIGHPRVKEERSTPSEIITIESNEEVPHLVALRLEERAEFIQEEGLIIGRPG